MPVDQNQPKVLGRPAKLPNGTRLIIAVVLIGLSVAVLALVDHFRAHPAHPVTAPHEPAQALITTPVPGADALGSKAGPPVDPPGPQNRANKFPVMPPRVVSPPLGVNAGATAKSYIVQVGVFNSPANARALQKQLQRSGINARLETRVQLGPFKNKQDADQAIARVKKLGIEGMVVTLR
ncbi:MAG: SPOR domain-containing protein [Burkholderiales bacterium]